jgi:antitoxin PrlF
MATTITIKGQVTIPKHIRDELELHPGCRLEFSVGGEGVFLRKAGPQTRRGRSRFAAVRGAADVRWRTDELMALLRDSTQP